jgi:hypothetical protein
VTPVPGRASLPDVFAATLPAVPLLLSPTLLQRAQGRDGLIGAHPVPPDHPRVLHALVRPGLPRFRALPESRTYALEWDIVCLSVGCDRGFVRWDRVRSGCRRPQPGLVHPVNPAVRCAVAPGCRTRLVLPRPGLPLGFLHPQRYHLRQGCIVSRHRESRYPIVNSTAYRELSDVLRDGPRISGDRVAVLPVDTRHPCPSAVHPPWLRRSGTRRPGRPSAS